MKWIEPEHSKEQVKKAGKSILEAEVNSDEFRLAVPVFHNWRSAHAFPMQIILDLARKNAIKIDKNALAVQRLKRVPSILNKLAREKNMSLSRMEDIAGCRVVVDSIRHVNRIHESLLRSRTKHILHRERNYIDSPKDSGYRGIHLIYRYNSGKSAYHGMSVELQIRSKVQHSWATAVEVVGAFTKQALKASSGDAIWLDLFKYASVEFSKMEMCNIDPKYDEVDTFSELKKCIDEIGLFDRLAAFKVATKSLTDGKQKQAGYFVILLDLEERIVKHARFDKNSLKKATDFYDQEEERYKNDANRDVVLVSAGSLRDLKKAYPNYFADTTEFEKLLQKVYQANNAMHATSV